MRLSFLTIATGSALCLAATFTTASKPVKVEFKSDVAPLLKKYCGACHGGKDGPSGVTLTTLQAESSFNSEREVWGRISKNLADKHMPPSGSPSPTQAERSKLVTFINGKLGLDKPNAGHVTLRRLNREEYNNTVRDLFGVDLRPAADFPSDDVGYGFDNIGDVLSMSPLLMDKYLKAAQEIAQQVIYTGPKDWHADGADLEGSEANVVDDGSKCLYTNGALYLTVNLPAEGTYRVTVVAYQDQGGDGNAKMSLLNGKQALKTVDVPDRRQNPGTFTATFHGSGPVDVGASFTNDYYKPATQGSPAEDRNLYIKSIEISGPIGGPSKQPPAEAKIITGKPPSENWAPIERSIFTSFASKAYRRPASKAEVDRLVAIAELAHKHGDTFESGIQLGVIATLCSPNFLFHVEEPVSGNLNSYEMASRLSYFLWSSMPDAELEQAAAKNTLQSPGILEHELDRMLKDPRARALADDFAGQWLQTRKLSVIRPDRKLFPGYTDEIRRSMETETKMFFQDVVNSDRSVLDFIAGKYSYLNAPLAKFYGVQANDLGQQFQRVEMPAERAGILTQGSVLVVTSNPTRTSPVKRGKWILENILGTPPPPPPPGVGVLKDDAASTENLSLKQRMEQHRKDPACAACHQGMDGLGFALENFDAIGGWRTKDGKFDVDASGTLPDGSAFTGPAELRQILLKKKELFVRCLSEKLLTYALGRGLENYDDPAVDKIVREVSQHDYKFSALVNAVVTSDPFRKSTMENKIGAIK